MSNILKVNPKSIPPPMVGYRFFSNYPEKSLRGKTYTLDILHEDVANRLYIPIEDVFVMEWTPSGEGNTNFTTRFAAYVKDIHSPKVDEFIENLHEMMREVRERLGIEDDDDVAPSKVN